MDREIYIPDQDYELLADTLRLALKHGAVKLVDERREEFRALLSALDGFGAPAVDDTGRADRAALVEALAHYTPLVSGDYDTRDLRWLLGDVGNVFPARMDSRSPVSYVA